MSRFGLLRSFVVVLTLALWPDAGWAQQWQPLTNSEINQVTNTPEWHAMEQTLQRAGYQKAANQEQGWKMWIDGANPFYAKQVRGGWRNPTLQRTAIPGYHYGVNEDQPFAFYTYTVHQLVNDVVESETFSWQTPQDVGDDARIVSIFKNYAGCVMGGLTATAFGSMAAGAYDGDSFMPTLIGGTAATYGGCLYSAASALAAWW